MEEIKNTVYGNVQFKEEGLLIEIPYGTTGDTEKALTDAEREEAFKCAKSYIKGRMKHCLDQLQANAAKATSVDKDTKIVAWPTGHFSGVTYDMMSQIEDVQTWSDLSIPMLYQITKALYYNTSEDYYNFGVRNNAFEIASEILACKINDEVSIRMTSNRALKIADKFGLKKEVGASIASGMSPDDALHEWDI